MIMGDGGSLGYYIMNTQTIIRQFSSRSRSLRPKTTTQNSFAPEFLSGFCGALFFSKDLHLC